jgi:Zn-dependent protease
MKRLLIKAIKLSHWILQTNEIYSAKQVLGFYLFMVCTITACFLFFFVLPALSLDYGKSIRVLAFGKWAYIATLVFIPIVEVLLREANFYTHTGYKIYRPLKEYLNK